MASTSQDNWSRGANNRLPADKLAPGFFVDAVNLDPQAGGSLMLRAGYEEAYAGNDVRGALALGDKILLADGADLVEHDTTTDSHRALRQIAGAGPFVGDEMGGNLYFCTANETLMYDGAQVTNWGVQTLASPPAASVESTGSLSVGEYTYAVTFTDDAGQEGGASDLGFFEVVSARGALVLPLPEPPAGGTVNVYIGKLQSTTLYWQRSVSSAQLVTVASLTNSGRRISAVGASTPPAGTAVAAVNGSLYIAQHKAVWATHPLHPHICYRHRGFYQFGAPVTGLSPVERGLYVHADRVYFLSQLAGERPQQIDVSDAVAVSGTETRLPDGRAAWMSEYGQVVGSPEGSLEFLTRDNYVPALAERGGAGVLNHNGSQSVVSTMRGIPRGNPLSMSDFAIAEVVEP